MNNTNEVKNILDDLDVNLSKVFESEKYKEYLNVMSKFHNYSLNNSMMILNQMPTATKVAGYRSWIRDFGRFVNLGEKGIKIITPVPVIDNEIRDVINKKTGEPVKDKDGRILKETVEVKRLNYKISYVFDISQTNGRDLPKLCVDELIGNVKNYELMLEALKQISPCKIVFKEIENEAKGFYSIKNNTITLKKDMPEVQTIKTLIHEMAHAKLHSKDSKEKESSQNMKEVQAESIAYAICKHYEIDTSDYSFGYITGWSSDKNKVELKESLNTILETCDEFISKLDEKMNILIAEKNKQLAIAFGNIGYLEMHYCDEGIDYTFYNKMLELKDGGVITDEKATFESIINTFKNEFKEEFSDYNFLDYKEFEKKQFMAEQRIKYEKENLEKRNRARELINAYGLNEVADMER